VKDLINRRRAALLAGLGVGCLVVAACGASASSPTPSGATTTSKTSCPVTFGELMPVSGKEAFVGTWFDTGADAGIYAVNHGGGVLGCKVQYVLDDTAGDPVDAVPALKALLLSKPAVVIGPSSLSILGIIKQFDPLKLPDLMQGGTTALDTMQYPYVWRVNSSDSQLLAGEAYFALNKLHCTKAAMMYEDSANAQDEVPPLKTAFTGNGGTIVSDQKLEPGASSYSSEIASAFANNPQCVFFHATPAEATTLFSDAAAQGHLNVPFITGDTGASIDLAKAMGLAAASKYMYGMTGPAVDAQSVTAFNAAFSGQYPGQQPLNANASEAMYDAVIVAALAMDEAHSINGATWNSYIEKVTNDESATSCYSYSTCLAMIKSGQQIDYEGAATNLDFNKFHNVFSPEQVVQFPASGGTPQPVLTESESQLAAMYHKS
jgi:ABC-type branched-subunit amino acid transport system substrate-binding protein